MKTLSNLQWMFQKTRGGHYRILGQDSADEYFQTSNIVEIIGDRVQTSSGSVYLLTGDPWAGMSLEDLRGVL